MVEYLVMVETNSVLRIPSFETPRLSVQRNVGMFLDILNDGRDSAEGISERAKDFFAGRFVNDGIVINGERLLDQNGHDTRSKVRIWTIDSISAQRRERGVVIGSFVKGKKAGVDGVPVFAAVLTPERDWYIASEYGDSYKNGEKITPSDYMILFELSKRKENLRKLLPLFGAGLSS